ncbi:MAG: phage holin family protein [Dehalococcoidia bacterium]
MTEADPHSIGGQFRRSRDEMRGIQEELAAIAEDMRGIARTEVELAKAELGEQMALGKRLGIWGAVAAPMAFITLIFAFTALMLGLAEAMPMWAAALITFGVVALITLIAALIAYGAVRKLTVVPKKTIGSMREDVRWAGAQLKSNMTLSGKETP